MEKVWMEGVMAGSLSLAKVMSMGVDVLDESVLTE